MKEVKYVLVWGTSARHYPQHCGLSHILHDEDVVQVVKKKVRQTFISLFNPPIRSQNFFFFDRRKLRTNDPTHMIG